MEKTVAPKITVLSGKVEVGRGVPNWPGTVWGNGGFLSEMGQGIKKGRHDSWAQQRHKGRKQHSICNQLPANWQVGQITDEKNWPATPCLYCKLGG